jgi:DNA primase
MNLLDLVQMNVKLKRVAQTNGGEYAGPCPFCGGRDRFRVWPNQDGGRYWCRGCRKHGDAIQWLRDMRGQSFKEACLELGIDPARRQEDHLSKPVREQRFHPREITPPPEVWQRKARAFIEIAKENLQKNPVALASLWGRGLKDDTIKRAELGWNPSGVYERREEWGLEALPDEQGRAKRLWLPTGLVIPLIQNNTVIRLRIRRPDGESSRYVVVAGSGMRPLILSPNRDAFVVVESELDAFLIDQEVGHLAGVIAMGSAQTRPDQGVDRILKQCRAILISLDADQAGTKSAWQFWLSSYPNANRWPVPIGKDPSEAFQQGLSIRAWVQAGLINKIRDESKEQLVNSFPSGWLTRFSDEQLERLAIMTVDGGLSDQEAMDKLTRH